MSDALPLGAFSISLTVNDLEASREFYQSLGFSERGAAGYETQRVVEPEATGPASFLVVDPDGNPVLVDQHR